MSDTCQTPEIRDPELASEAIHVLIGRYLYCVIVGVLRLRRVQLALTTIVVSLLIMYFPHLESLRDDLLMLMAGVLMVALGGYSVTDALHNGQDNQERLEDLLEGIADELGVNIDALDEPEEELQDAQT